MFLLFIFSGIWMLSFAGWGRFLLRSPVSVPRPASVEDFGIQVVLGHIPVLAIGFALHFFVPLSGWIVSGIPLGGLLLAARQTKKNPFRTHSTAFALAIFASFFASRTIVHGDSGYYGIPVISWIVSEPVVRGLANLDPTYGYNSSWWILASAMSWPMGAHLGVTGVNVPFLCGVGMIILSAIHRILTRKGSRTDWYLVPAFYLWLRQVVGVNTPSPSTDIPANLCMLLAFQAMVRYTDRPRIRQSPSSRAPVSLNGPNTSSDETVFFVSFAILAASAKLSAGLLLVVAFAWIVLLFFKDRHFFLILQTRRKLFFCAGVLMALQLAHGFLLSGYPVFPSGFGGWWDIPWRVDPALPSATVQRAHDWAQTFGATAEQTASMPVWRLWIERQGSTTNLLMAGAVGLAGILGVGITLFQRRKEALAGGMLLLPATLAGGLLAWNLFHAPALRFGAGYAFAVLGCFAAFVGPVLPPRMGKICVFLWLVASTASMSKLAIERPPSWINISPMPVSTFKERKTHQGETIFVPDGGLAWIGPRPSTPSFEFNPGLWIIRSQKSGQIVEFRRSHF